MASHPYMSTAQSDSGRAAIAELKILTVDRLKKVLRTENLTVGGIKSELQVRLIGHIERCAASGDYARIDRIRSMIKNMTAFGSPYPMPHPTYTSTSSLSPQFASPTPRNNLPLAPYTMPPYSQPRVVFRDSPFYDINKRLSDVMELKARELTRDTARLNVRLGHAEIDQLQRDPNTRVMVFCAADAMGPYSEPRDIAFPQHGELKCNSDDVRHNLKGMKGKPGTTRPADITQYMRKSQAFVNAIELVYALTTKRYYLVVNLVTKKPIDGLVAEITRRPTPFSKDRVLREMQSRAEDPDIVATSTNMSLKDPLQMTRIQTPCRGLSCTHNGCFDAAVFLALQEQAPTWTCPICHKPVIWDNIAYDHYFADILKNVDGETEQVTVEPNGQWHRGEITTSESNERHGGVHPKQEDYDDDDDDIVEITDNRASGPRDITTSPSMTRTPPFQSMSITPIPNSASSNVSMSSLLPDASASRSSKRPFSETIDLTLDDSDDDQIPVSRIKRPSLSLQTSDPLRMRSQDGESFRFHMPPPPTNTSYGPVRFGGF